MLNRASTNQYVFNILAARIVDQFTPDTPHDIKTEQLLTKIRNIGQNIELDTIVLSFHLLEVSFILKFAALHGFTTPWCFTRIFFQRLVI